MLGEGVLEGCIGVTDKLGVGLSDGHSIYSKPNVVLGVTVGVTVIEGVTLIVGVNEGDTGTHIPLKPSYLNPGTQDGFGVTEGVIDGVVDGVADVVGVHGIYSNAVLDEGVTLIVGVIEGVAVIDIDGVVLGVIDAVVVTVGVMLAEVEAVHK